MLIFFDFSDNQKQPDYTPLETNLAKPAHNPIYRGPKMHTKGHIFSNGATAPQTNWCGAVLFEQFCD
jgi:hypothetical protein